MVIGTVTYAEVFVVKSIEDDEFDVNTAELPSIINLVGTAT